jgi:hypothetical protein
LYITGPAGSSNFISIAIIIKKGENIIIQKIDHIMSENLFITLHHASSGVFLISINGISFNNDIVVFVFVTSKVFVMYLYFIQSILEKSHNSYNSFEE